MIYFGIRDTPIEREYVDSIARKILIPKISIEYIINENKSITSTKLLKKLCKLYEVSKDVMKTRLVDDLNLFSTYQLQLEL